ncbi:MAG: 4Fe-4S binding protein [Euryarchaeota archaeon]|nr:4Fe-4S binding protein [Euryarchaeota archaeon]
MSGRVGVVLCDDAPVEARVAEGLPALHVGGVGLERERVVAWLREQRLSAAVFLCTESEGNFADAVEQAGLPPFSYEVAPPGTGRTELLAKVRRAAIPKRVEQRHLKMKPKFSGRMSRRDLLSALFRVEHMVVPAVEKEWCVARGCTICATACPFNAIVFDDKVAAVHKERCEACGLCATACPADAITFPTWTKEQIEAELEVLAGSGLPLVIGCAAEPPRDGAAVLRLPCVGMATAFWMLRALEMGAPEVAVAACTCGAKFPAEEREKRVGFAQELLRRWRVEPERLRSADTPHRFTGATPLHPGRHDANLVALISSASARLGEAGRLEHDGGPLGLIAVTEKCTLCGLCAERCPFGALKMGGGRIAGGIVSADANLLLEFEHLRCTACNICVATCPERCMALRRGFDGGQLKPVALRRDEGLRCASCGRLYTSAALVAKLRERLERRGATADFMRYCPDCRMGAGMKSASSER